jgi:hypothetical protein
MASNPKILNYNNISFDKLEYYQPHKTNQNTQVSTVSYRLKANQMLPIYIETPKLKTTSGIIKLENRYFIDFELDINGDTSSSFYEFLNKLDEKNVMSCHYNSHEWFNQRIPLDVIEEYYKSPIRLQRGGKLPTVRVRIPTHHGKILSEFYNSKRDMIDISKIEIGDEVICILEFVGLRFLSQQFIAEWELSKLKLLRTIPEQTTIPSGYYFSDVVEPIKLSEPESIETHHDILEDALKDFNEPNQEPITESISEVNHNHNHDPVVDFKEDSQELRDLAESNVQLPLLESLNATVIDGEETANYNFDELDDDNDVIFEDSEYELDDLDCVEEVMMKAENNIQPSEEEVKKMETQMIKQMEKEAALNKLKEYEELMRQQKEYLESLNLIS